MVEHKSAEQVEADHLAALGQGLGPLFHALDNEVGWLHAKWKQYRHLYAAPEAIDVLNEAAGFFFRLMQDMMWEDAVLHVARLTDPPRSMRKDNLTFRRLPAAISEPALAGRVSALVDAAVSDSEFARDWRNRHLAHRDLHLALGSLAEPLALASRQHMETVLASFRSVLNAVNLHYWDSTTAYEEFLAEDDAESLLFHLRAALKVERKRRERWGKGVVLPEDLDPEGEV